MAIDRYSLVKEHNPVLEKADTSSPLTVGNGEFAFTADVTGLQSLYDEYRDELPLCTMSQWGWHTSPAGPDTYGYTLDDLVMTEYEYNGRKVTYPKKKMPGNEKVYDWLRQNPHRLNLARIGFRLDGRVLSSSQLAGVRQELKLYEGLLESRFELDGRVCHVRTCCHGEEDTLAVGVSCGLLREQRLTVVMDFPYGSPDITASNWDSPDRHSTLVAGQDGKNVCLKRVLDRDSYYVTVHVDGSGSIRVCGHEVTLCAMEEELEFTVSFRKEAPAEQGREEGDAQRTRQQSAYWWKRFWEEGGILHLSSWTDQRAKELERRIILSMYLLAINSCGSAPPQETGLTCNSWYGKMHLEMYFWHCAWAPLWGRSWLLERSLPWYLDHLRQARENAARNGYRGCRWPKMVALEGIDCPSGVAPLLIWQQPHIIFMLELVYRSKPHRDFLEKYWVLVQETADFMVDLAVYNEQTGEYDLAPPVIPVQECHRPEDTRNPAFELEYWRYALELAAEWAGRLDRPGADLWLKVARHMAHLPMGDGLYLAHADCPDTFTRFNRDHPSMLGAFGVLPGGDIDADVMERTLHKVLTCWQYPTLWGWDFAVMAMTAVRLGKTDEAVDILLKDTPKNDYVKNGHNRQKLRKDLPVYLPGNGSLLLAASMMAAGYEGGRESGFPQGWEAEFEDIHTYV